jgi:dihydrofolate reductase
MFSVILAVDNQGGIGKTGGIPWYNKQDLRLFKKKTTGNVIIMGRGTWESLPLRPLPNRVNVILSNTLKEVEGITVCGSLAECIRYLQSNHSEKEWFIIGGGKVYNQVLKLPPLLNKIYLTRVAHDYECDVKVDLNCIRHKQGKSFSEIDEKLNKNQPYTWSYREYNF